jgi:hypothetical protein
MLGRFQTYSSTRQLRSRPGDILPWDEEAFSALPALETVAAVGGAAPATVPVGLTAKLSELGLLEVSCVSADPALAMTWPLEFNLRPHEHGPAAVESTRRDVPNAAPDLLDAAGQRIRSLFTRRAVAGDRIGAPRLFKTLEQTLGLPRTAWNGALVHSLWPALEETAAGCRQSADHEEAWLMLAGFLLRPGFGAVGDAGRIDSLWRLREAAPQAAARRIRVQDYILWLRLAGGLSAERQAQLFARVRPEIDRGASALAELVLLLGALERLPVAAKSDLVGASINSAAELARGRRHCAHYFVALGQLLNRAPLYAGPQNRRPARPCRARLSRPAPPGLGRRRSGRHPVAVPARRPRGRSP